MLRRMVLRTAGMAVAAAPLVKLGMAGAEESPGVTRTEITIGNTIPYSGPASAFSVVGRAQLAYMAMVNDQGGVNGRKIKLISLDNAYSPPKALEQTRKLVEEERVLAISGTLGTPTNAAIQKYLNQNGVPHIFCIAGASRFSDPQHFPWTVGLVVSFRREARIIAKYLLAQKPDAKIAVLYQNDDLGKDGLKGLSDGLGNKASGMIAATASYEVGDPTIDSQIVSLQGSGADTLIMFTTPKAAAQAIRKAYDLGWRPLRVLNSPSSESIPATLVPAGLDRSTGIIGVRFNKDPNDPQWKDDQGVRDWGAWMRSYLPGADFSDGLYVTGYDAAQLLVHVLRQCGEALTRENLIEQVANLNLDLPMLLPGIRITTSRTDFEPIKQVRFVRFNGVGWKAVGEVMSN